MPRPDDALERELTLDVDQPKSRELLWLVLGFGSLVGLCLASFLAGKAGVAVFLGLMIIAAFVVIVIIPRSLAVGAARVIATVIVILLVCLMSVTGLPLIVAELLSPVAQSLQDSGGNLGITTNLVWMVVVVLVWILLVVLSVFLYFSRSVPGILLSAFVLAVAFFPFVGMILQEKLRHG